MKIVTANNKKVLRLSKAEWNSIGLKAGWVKKAQDEGNESPSTPSTPSVKKPSWLDVDDTTSEQISMLKRFIKAIKLHAPKKIQTNIHFAEIGDNQFELEVDIPGDTKIKLNGDVKAMLREVRNLAKKYNFAHLLSGASLSPGSYADEEISKVLNRGVKTSTPSPSSTQTEELDKPRRGRPRKNPLPPEEIDDGTEYQPKTIKELEQEALEKLNKVKPEDLYQ